MPLDHIKRAVTHNLPCFTVNFTESEQLPSASAAAEELYEHFERQNVQLNSKFSMVRYVGNQLKIGVRSKEGYALLCNTKVWPTEIKKKKITVLIPKFTPSQFALVVPYVAPEFIATEAAQKVIKLASTASEFHAIVYSYPRSTNDFRFTVSDLKEYNGLLRLGHIGIGDKMRVVTPYRSAKKLTYCSKCWMLGHTRNNCTQLSQKCRFCPPDYDKNHDEVCSKQHKCAQCLDNHPSLDLDCQAIQQYRNNLNRVVKQAAGEGVIKLPALENAKTIATQCSPKFDVQAFPPLTTTSTITKSCPAP